MRCSGEAVRGEALGVRRKTKTLGIRFLLLTPHASRLTPL